MASTENPHFFAAAGGPLFAVHHAPPPAASPRVPIVFCPPFGEEKLWAHRVFVNMARQLASQGHHVLRFDFHGSGDSAGEPADASLETNRADIALAIAHLQGLSGQRTVGLLGLRLGASLAAAAATQRDDVSCVALWEPVLEGNRYLQELLRINLATQLAVYREIRAPREALLKSVREGRPVNIDGYDTSEAFLTQLDGFVLTAGMLARPSLVVQIDRADAPVRPSLQRLLQDSPSTRLEQVTEEPFWKEIRQFYDVAPDLFRVTSTWLAAQ